MDITKTNEENNLLSTNVNGNDTISLEKEKRFKEDIKKYFSQLNSGCYRVICYNRYCKKSNSKYNFIIRIDICK